MIVLDASALLALLNKEAGADIVHAALPDSAISVVNLAEVLTKAVEQGLDVDRTVASIRALSIAVEPFDETQAIVVAQLRPTTVSKGLSLADRACLALATVKGGDVLTADRVWSTLPLGVKVTLIR